MNFISQCLVIFTSILLIGCESKRKRYALNTFNILSTKNMNNNSVVRLDLMQVLDQSLWDALSKMESKQYFKTRKSILTHNAENLRIWAFEPLPRTKLQSFCISNWAPMCYGVVVFMSYQNDKENKFTVSPKTKHLTVKLGINGLDKTLSVKKAGKNLLHKQTYSIGAENDF